MLKFVILLLLPLGVNANEIDQKHNQEKSILYTHSKNTYVEKYSLAFYTNLKLYSYSVSGYDDNGNYFYGNVDVDQSGGDGYLYDDEGNSISIYVDWAGKGQLDGYDTDGTHYNLEVD